MIIIPALSFSWVNIFVNFLPLETEYFVWDLFMLKGSVMFFRITLTILELLQEQILAESGPMLQMLIMTKSRSEITPELLQKNLVNVSK